MPNPDVCGADLGDDAFELVAWQVGDLVAHLWPRKTLQQCVKNLLIVYIWKLSKYPIVNYPIVNYPNVNYPIVNYPIHYPIIHCYSVLAGPNQLPFPKKTPMHLRIFQHTPQTYSTPPTNLRLEFLNHLGVISGMTGVWFGVYIRLLPTQQQWIFVISAFNALSVALFQPCQHCKVKVS